MMKLRCLVFMQVIEGEQVVVFHAGQTYDVNDSLSLRLLTDHGDNFAVEIGDDVSIPEDSEEGESEPVESEENAEIPAESEEPPAPITASAYESAAEDINESVRRTRRRS